MNSTPHYVDETELFKLVNKSPIKYNRRKIKRACEFATEVHGDQRRVSGIPYILHPITVAFILVQMGMDTDAVCAGLLHDTVEDTDTSLKQLEDEFGEDVAQMVDGLTKISKIKYTDREEHQAENVRKMLVAMSNDIRVIIIKLADRLHNMRTIECIAEQKRRDKSLECMEVYAPIAHRLGMKAVKEELEDLSIKYLDPIGVEEIESHLALSEEERGQFIEATKNKILNKIGRSISHVQISGRVKSITSIYRKAYMQGKSLSEIFDIFAVRILVDTIPDCYNVLGIVHDIFQPLPTRFKDYISTPKANMYQSLHTTVFDRNSIPFEIQIRTYEMHETAEYGIAAHWKYKAKLSRGGKRDTMDDKLEWIRKMLEIQSSAEDATDIVRAIKNDLTSYEVYVFTPKGDVFCLPFGSTIVDMAYAIHSEVGHRMVGAKANMKMVPINYKLQTGDIIEILTKKDSPGPKRDWLNLAKTGEARNKIKNWFKREKRDENIENGKESFETECKKFSCIFKPEDLEECVSQIFKKQHVNSMDDFYAAIGYGGIQLWKIMPRIKDIHTKKYADIEDAQPKIVYKQKEKVGSGVKIEGVDDVLIKFSKCCNPLPGDEIIGYVTRGFGVSVHKRDCTNVPDDIGNCEEPERWVKATWNKNVKEIFKSSLEIKAANRKGLLADVTNQLFAQHINIHSLNCKEGENDFTIIHLTIDINGMEHLGSVIKHLSKVQGIQSINRV